MFDAIIDYMAQLPSNLTNVLTLALIVAVWRIDRRLVELATEFKYFTSSQHNGD